MPAEETILVVLPSGNRRNFLRVSDESMVPPSPARSTIHQFQLHSVRSTLESLLYTGTWSSHPPTPPSFLDHSFTPRMFSRCKMDATESGTVSNGPSYIVTATVGRDASFEKKPTLNTKICVGFGGKSTNNPSSLSQGLLLPSGICGSRNSRGSRPYILMQRRLWRSGPGNTVPTQAQSGFMHGSKLVIEF